MAETTARLATTQLADLWKLAPQQASPYAADFSWEAAEKIVADRLGVFEEYLRQAGEQECDLVVTMEDMTGLSAFMTFLDDPGLFRGMVEFSAPRAEERMTALAREFRMHIVACYYEQTSGDICNYAVLFGRDGEVIGKYAKVHLPLYETWLVKAGDSFPVFDTDIGKIGMTICYDQMWPESVTACALNGAEIVCLPSAATPAEFRSRTRALDNQVFFVTSTPGGSVIAAPNGDLLASTGTGPRALTYADVDVKGATLANECFYEYLYSGIRDHKERHLKLRRPEAYAPISSAHPPLLESYPEGGLANTPEAIQRVYEIQRQQVQKRLRGEKDDYDWRW